MSKASGLNKVKLRKSKKHEAKLRQRLAEARMSGETRRTIQLTREYLNSYDAKYIAIRQANRDLKPHLRISPTKLKMIAEGLNAWHGTTKEVVVHFKPKASNPYDFRPIMEFEIENRALQVLVGRALMAQADLHPRQYAVRGGRDAAVDAVLHALGQGYQWISEIDISNCYPSFDGEKLPELLPLPKEVTRKVLCARHLALVPGNIKAWIGSDEDAECDEAYQCTIAEALSEVQRGIPQGSAASPLVAEMLLAPVLTQLPSSGLVLNYADNFLVMAREESDRQSTNLALGGALVVHPAGPLQPITKQSTSPAEDFNFLGYTFEFSDGLYAPKPSMKNWERFEQRFKSGICSLEKSSATAGTKKKKVVDLERYVRSWTAAFNKWPGACELRKKCLGRIQQVV